MTTRSFPGLPARAYQVIGVTAAAWGVALPRPRAEPVHRRTHHCAATREFGLPALAFAFAF